MTSTLIGQARIVGAVCVFLWLERARGWDRNSKAAALLEQFHLLLLFPPSTSSYARFKASMGFRAAGLALVKAWCSCGTALLRLIGLPAGVLAIYLEAFGSNPIVSTLIVHRLRRRILLSASCTRKYGQDMSAILDLSSAAAASTALTANSTAPAQTPARQQTPARKGARSAKRTKSIASVSTSTSTFTPVQPSPIMPPSHSRAKTVSHIDLVNQGKRLSLQFPIQPAAGSSSPIASPPATRPQSWIGTPIVCPRRSLAI